MANVRNVFILGLCLLAGACGIKPGQVSAPEGAENTSFPHTYPHVETKPKPENDQ